MFFRCQSQPTTYRDSLFVKIRYKAGTDPLDPIAGIIDYSNYSPDHPLYNTDHQNELTYWKSDIGK